MFELPVKLELSFCHLALAHHGEAKAVCCSTAVCRTWYTTESNMSDKLTDFTASVIPGSPEYKYAKLL